jgi:hypothetical protein
LLLEDIAQVNAQYLQRLCDDKCPESETLDFKRDLPGNSDKDKHELLKDICALANAGGGDLVYCVDEVDGVAALIVPASAEPADNAKRRISQVLDAGIEPRVPGVRLHHVEVPGGYALVVRVPASYEGPHCLRSNNNRRFVIRNGTGTTDMSYEQIRSAFDRTATLAEKARHFVATRNDLIGKRKTPTPVMQGPIWVLHLVSLAGIAERRTVDLRELHSRSFTDFIGPGWGGASRTFNFDGLAVHPGGARDDGHYTYNHIFRTGAMEAAQIGGGQRQIDNGGPERSIVWSLDMSKFFHWSASKFIQSAKSLGFGGPALLGVAILDVQGYELGIGDAFHRFSQATADRPHLIPPEVWIDNLDTVSIDDALRPSLDVLWQAFGLERCLDFDAKSGVYSPRRG